MLGTVCKAGDVMDLFTTNVPEWGVSEVADHMRLPKSSAHALLATLAEIGLVRRTSGGRYRLGWRVFELHRTLMETTDFLEPSRALLGQLADNLQATVHVAALRKHDVIYLEKVTGSRAANLAASAVGLVAPAHSTSLGKVLLADRDAEFCGSVADRHGLRQNTAKTVTSLAGLLDELETVRQRGWAGDLSETLPGVCCVGVPIRDQGGSVQAAISVTVPARQFERLKAPLRRSVQNAAASIMRRAYGGGKPLQRRSLVPAENGAA